MKKSLIIIFNILIFIILFISLEFIIYKFESNNISKTEPIPKFSYKIFNPEIKYDYLKSKDNNLFRNPNGLEYSSMPITIFGCSVGYGQYLNDDQTFSYYLSKETKRPVYNRSIAGAGLQNMYYQVQSDEFYSDVPYSTDVIYIYINDHFRRMLGLPFYIIDRDFFLHYKYKNNQLIKDNYNNPILNFIKSSYSLSLLRTVYYDKIQRYHYKKLGEEAFVYFLKSRDELKKHWGKDFNFYVFFFIKSKSDKYLIEQLKNNGFKVILIQDLTSEDLNKPPYLASDNSHPSEEVWKLLTPKISDIISDEDY